jgi:MOSC domain-containing protein YiiM
MTAQVTSSVTAVSRDRRHAFSKPVRESIRLVTGLGVEGDAHAGTTVQHRSRVRRDPTQPNLRQVHLVAAELHHELAGRGFAVSPGQMGENVTTAGIDLLDLPVGTLLRLGEAAVIEVTGLRNPCVQLDGFRKGLMKAVLGTTDGTVVYRAGIMAVVRTDGVVRAGDPIDVVLPPPPHRPLDLV